MLMQKARATVGWKEWRHQSTRGRWKWISPRALEWFALALPIRTKNEAYYLILKYNFK